MNRERRRFARGGWGWTLQCFQYWKQYYRPERPGLFPTPRAMSGWKADATSPRPGSPPSCPAPSRRREDRPGGHKQKKRGDLSQAIQVTPRCCPGSGTVSDLFPPINTNDIEKHSTTPGARTSRHSHARSFDAERPPGFLPIASLRFTFSSPSNLPIKLRLFPACSMGVE